MYGHPGAARLVKQNIKKWNGLKTPEDGQAAHNHGVDLVAAEQLLDQLKRWHASPLYDTCLLFGIPTRKNKIPLQTLEYHKARQATVPDSHFQSASVADGDKEPSNTELRRAIHEILTGADLMALTTRGVRVALAEKFGINATRRKEDVRRILNELSGDYLH
ncbi:hypothetical protein THASP1DRAFT_29916 [Thamnocephalis sphaerospora]|uniref:DEK-C domain-containing protein n=1 Tax=Thamnocephalis sphaerospora TaxID=78915 RepID=A0A4P9XQG7_9FUNG|nr:hypothetical protein THASP1DRAFT_29916 [Thamnocephalis sphaerospora]|eukprot:RKP08283.1 hypothetical protein THASP1DRAFT_29916 [Thamnocephalis sphaerospora]